MRDKFGSQERTSLFRSEDPIATDEAAIPTTLVFGEGPRSLQRSGYQRYFKPHRTSLRARSSREFRIDADADLMRRGIPVGLWAGRGAASVNGARVSMTSEMNFGITLPVDTSRF